MKKILVFLTAAAVLLIAAFFLYKPLLDSTTLVISGGTVIDCAGGTPLQNSVILIEDGLILEVGPEGKVKVPWFSKKIDARGKYIIPGLADMHVHFVDEAFCPLFLNYGVTTVRDMGNDADTILSLRDRINRGEVLGPTIYASGYLLNNRKIPFGASQYTAEIQDESAAKRAVAALALKGVDWIKIYITLPPRLVKTVLEEARRHNLPVAGHLRRVNARFAARNGIRSLEHATGIAEALLEDRNFEDVPADWTISPKTWPRINLEKRQALIDLLLRQEVYITANLTLYKSFCLTQEEIRAKAPKEIMPETFQQGWENYVSSRFLLIREDHEGWVTTRARLEEFLRLFKDSGGKVLAGTDTPWPFLVPGLSLHEELELLVEAGFSPQEALLTATRYPAEAMRLEGTMGTLERGKRADMIVLEANPLKDIRNTRKIYLVFKEGRRINPKDLIPATS